MGDGESYYSPFLAVLKTKITTFDFSDDTSGVAGEDLFAYRYQNNSNEPVTNDVPDITFTSAQYDNIKADDGIFQQDETDADGNYAAHRFVFNVSCCSSSCNLSLLDANVTWDGKGYHESQNPVAVYGDQINGQAAFDVTPYFNAKGNNTAVITAGRTQKGYYGTVLIVVYEAESEPYRQIWVNEGSDCLMEPDSGVFDDVWVGYTVFDNVSTTGLASAKITTVLESGDNNNQNTILLNGHTVSKAGSSGSDPSFKYYNVTDTLQNGINELGVWDHGTLIMMAWWTAPSRTQSTLTIQPVPTLSTLL